MSDVIEVSYTGDLLAHRRCPRSWCYENHAGFHPYEQVQAMEGRLVHHAMEWMARQFGETKQLVTRDALKIQLEAHFRTLWARGIRTTFSSKSETIDRVLGNLFRKGDTLDAIVKVAIEGCQHTEYELRSVRKLVEADFSGKSRMLLTGIIDIVVQQITPLTYQSTWMWTSSDGLEGKVVAAETDAQVNDVEIWDYKGAQASTPNTADYVKQLLTYAALYEDRTGVLPARCVLFFVNEKPGPKRLLAIPIDRDRLRRCVDWTVEQVKELRQTVLQFEKDPEAVLGGSMHLRHEAVGKRIDVHQKKQCTACGQRFDCTEYRTNLGRSDHPDINLTAVNKN